MIRLSLPLPGPLLAILGEEPLPDFRTRNVQALLMVLAVEMEPQPRERPLAMPLFAPAQGISHDLESPLTCFELSDEIKAVSGVTTLAFLTRQSYSERCQATQGGTHGK